jgi:hypothetical protein
VKVRVVFAAVMLLGCGGSTGPTAGILKVNLATPHADDGGLLLTLSGGPIDSIESTGNPLYTSRADADSVKVIITGQLTSGTIAQIHIPDSRQASSYSAIVIQAAARGSYAQRNPDSYSVTLAP